MSCPLRNEWKVPMPEDPDAIKQISPRDPEIEEEWVRETRESWIRGVGAYKISDEDAEFRWQVSVGAMEFVREGSLESELRSTIDFALRLVTGVTDVVEFDREVWGVSGSPTGRELVQAVADAVDDFAERIRENYGNVD
jgi:hypothetical protein